MLGSICNKLFTAGKNEKAWKHFLSCHSVTIGLLNKLNSESYSSEGGKNKIPMLAIMGCRENHVRIYPHSTTSVIIGIH